MPHGDLLKPGVRGQLRSLKLKIESRLAGEGVAWLVLAAVAVVFVSLGLDYLLRLEKALRIVVMSGALAGLAYVAWRQLIWPLQVRMSDEDLALLVEKRFDKLSDRLISAIQFGKETRRAPGTSAAMIDLVAAEANAMVAGLEFEKIVERRNLARLARLAFCAVVLLGGFGAWQSGAMALWFERNVLFQETPWPQNTYLEVITPKGLNDFYVLRGDDLTVQVQVAADSSSAPQFVVFHAEYPSVGSTEERVDANPDGRTYTKVFQAVSEQFSFYVTGDDDKRDKANPHKVLLIDPPALKNVEYSVNYPHYMNRPASRYEPVKGIMAVPLGSEITFRAEATKELAAAKMLLDDREIGSVEIGVGAGVGAGVGSERSIGGKIVKVDGANVVVQTFARGEPGKELTVATDEATAVTINGNESKVADLKPDLFVQVSPAEGTAAKITATKDAPECSLVGRLGLTGANQLVSHMLRFALTDSDGYSNRRGQQFMIQVQPDLAPIVELKTRGVGASVTPNAIIPLTVQLRDDYGVASATVCLLQVHKAATQATEASQPASEPASEPAPGETLDWGQKVSVEPPLGGRKDFTGPHIMDMGRLGKKKQASPGDIVAVVCEAVDTMDSPLGGPNKKTATRELKIVTPLDVQTDLWRRHMDVALEFSQALVTQATALEKTKAAIDEADQTVMGMHVRESVSGQGAVGIQAARAADQLQTIYEEMINNRVFDDAMQKRVADGEVEPLKALAPQIGSVSVTLNRAAAMLEKGNVDAQQMKRLLTQAADVQEQIYDKLTDILKTMNEIGGRAELINQIMALQEIWRKVMTETDNARRGEIGSILGTAPAARPATPPAPEPATRPASQPGTN